MTSVSQGRDVDEVTDSLAGVFALYHVDLADLDESISPMSGFDLSDFIDGGGDISAVVGAIADAERWVDPSLAALDVRELIRVNRMLGLTEPIIEGFIPRYGKILLAGQEGVGKTTLLRQVGNASSIGVHPTDSPKMIPPKRVLSINVEYRPDELADDQTEMFDPVVGDRYTGRYYHATVGHALNLISNEADRAWLRDLVDKFRPDILTLESYWALTGGHNTIRDNEVAPLFALLEELQSDFDGFAIILAGHPRKTPDAKGNDPLGFSGSPVPNRWADISFTFTPSGLLIPNRLYQRGGRHLNWPKSLRKGSTAETEWPWVAVNDPDENLFRLLEDVLRDTPRLIDAKQPPSGETMRVPLMSYARKKLRESGTTDRITDTQAETWVRQRIGADPKRGLSGSSLRRLLLDYSIRWEEGWFEAQP